MAALSALLLESVNQLDSEWVWVSQLLWRLKMDHSQYGWQKGRHVRLLHALQDEHAAYSILWPESSSIPLSGVLQRSPRHRPKKPGIAKTKNFHFASLLTTNPCHSDTHGPHTSAPSTSAALSASVWFRRYPKITSFQQSNYSQENRLLLVSKLKNNY